MRTRGWGLCGPPLLFEGCGEIDGCLDGLVCVWHRWIRCWRKRRTHEKEMEARAATR